MNVLLKQVTIISTSSPFHRQVKDILIIDGIISQISDSIAATGIEQIAGDDLHVSAGWMDIFADFGEPGNEHRETFETGAASAIAGGFTDVMLVPDAGSPVSSAEHVAFLTQRSAFLPVTIRAAGTVTKNGEGKELAEMYDMHRTGAVAFTDGRKSIENSALLLKGLQYLLAKNAVLIQLPADEQMSTGGQMNEGIMSTMLGLPGIPALGEELRIARDIEIAAYTGAKLHFTGISTGRGSAMIKGAKERGLPITCSVTPYHLFFCDEDLAGYDTNFKVNPPLRSRADMHALRLAFSNGDIDCMASHHAPQCSDDKICEFEYARNGMIGLQTLFGAVSKFAKNIEEMMAMLTTGPRNIFGLTTPEIAEGETACLTIFQPANKFLFSEGMILSKSKNSPFINQEMTGKVNAVIHKNNLTVNA